MKSIMNAGFIGCGAIAQKKHLPLCAENTHVHVKALFDINQETAYMCKDQYHMDDAKVLGSVEEMLSLSDIDLIFVSTPNNTHAEYSIASLNAKKHVICEKPMAMSALEAKRMVDASRKNKKLLHISYQNRYTPQAQYVKQLVEEGFFSNIYYAKAYAIRRRSIPNWGANLNKSIQGGGPLIDIGSHALDLAMWLTGSNSPKYVVGTTYDHIVKKESGGNYYGAWDAEKADVEDCALGFIVMQNGMTLTMDATYALNVATEYEASVDLFGVKAGVQLREMNEVTLIHELQGKMCMSTNRLQETLRALTPKNVALSASAREHKAILDLLLNGADWDPALEEAYTVARVVDGIYASAESGQPYFF